MGFRKDSHPGVLNIRFRMEAVCPDTDFSLSVRTLRLKERQAIVQEFVGQSDEEYDEVKVRAALLGEALVEMPLGYDDFPEDERPLSERGKEYLSSLPAEFDDAIMTAYNIWMNRGRPDFTTPSA